MNSVLYRLKQRGLCDQDNQFRWSLAATSKASPIKSPPPDARVPGDVRRPAKVEVPTGSQSIPKVSPTRQRPVQGPRAAQPKVRVEEFAKPETNEALAQELVLALDAEIECLKNPKQGDSDRRVRIYKGRFLKRLGDLYLYVFTLENFLASAAVDDIPAEVEVKGARHNGQIVSVQGLEITIGLFENLGAYIAEATLITNLWYLLEALKKRIVSLAESRTLPVFSTKVFGLQESSTNLAEVPDLEPGAVKQGPNEDGRKAIALALGSEVSFVWGPPGTGKTTTLGRAVEAFWKQRRRVLIGSHTNTAVNTALGKFLEVVKHLPEYEDGKFIRIGVAGDGLAERFPLCVVENVAAKVGAELKGKLDKLRNEQELLQLKMAHLQEIRRLSEEIVELERETTIAASEKEQSAGALASAKETSAKIEGALTEASRKYQESLTANVLRRKLTGLNPERWQKRTKALQEELLQAKLQKEKLELAWASARRKDESFAESLENSRQGLRSLLSKHALTVESARQQLETQEAKLAEIACEISKIEQELADLARKIILNAQVVGATLTKICIGRELAETTFDVLAIDEASMAPLPHLYLALKDKSASCLVGDFRQLPPICQSKEAVARKWLGRDIFKQSGIERTIDNGGSDRRLEMLHSQYRMVREIADIPNELFYGGRLQTERSSESDVFLAPSALVVCDTSSSGAWVSRLSSGSRYNVCHALICGRVVKDALDDQRQEIGVITPYAAQARLIKKIMEDERFEQVRVSTVHGFQGSELRTIILDTVESYPERVSPLLDESIDGSDAARLLNVAITRAETKLIIVANLGYLSSKLRGHSLLSRILNRCAREGTVLDASGMIDQFFCEDFDRIARELIPVRDGVNFAETTLHSEKNFFEAFIKDLRSAKKEVIILSPFLTTNRAGAFGNIFVSLVHRGVRVVVYTRSVASQTESMAEEAERVIGGLRQLQVKVIQRSRMHQKIALIDREIAWEGSLNILSHRDAGEVMRRIPFRNTAEKLVEFLDVAEGEYDETPPETNLRCAVCGKPLVVRKGRFGLFLACLAFPRCRAKHRFPTEGEVILKRECRKSGHPFVIRRGRHGFFAACQSTECGERLPIKR